MTILPGIRQAAGGGAGRWWANTPCGSNGHDTGGDLLLHTSRICPDAPGVTKFLRPRVVCLTRRHPSVKIRRLSFRHGSRLNSQWRRSMRQRTRSARQVNAGRTAGVRALRSYDFDPPAGAEPGRDKARAVVRQHMRQIYMSCICSPGHRATPRPSCRATPPNWVRPSMLCPTGRRADSNGVLAYNVGCRQGRTVALPVTRRPVRSATFIGPRRPQLSYSFTLSRDRPSGVGPVPDRQQPGPTYSGEPPGPSRRRERIYIWEESGERPWCLHPMPTVQRSQRTHDTHRPHGVEASTGVRDANTSSHN